MMRRTIAAAVCLALPASGWAQVAARPAPSLGEGVQLGVDPWVAGYKQTMDQLTQQMNRVGYEIRDIKVTPTPEGKKKARAELAEKVKKADAIEALAKAAEQTMVAHVLSGPKKVHRFGVLKKVKEPGFDRKEDSEAARPHEDTTLRRKADPQAASDAAPAAPSAGPAAPAEAAAPVPEPAPRAAVPAAARPRMKSLASNFSYNATGGGVSSRFGSSPSIPDVGSFLAPAPRTPSAAFADPGASAPSGSGWMPPSAGAAAGTSVGGTSDGGTGMSSGWSGSSGGASDFKPAANPSAAALSTNKSDVAKLAYERAQQQAEQKRQDAKEAAQQAQQEQQMKMQMMVTLLTQGAQIALKLIEDREKKKKEKETK